MKRVLTSEIKIGLFIFATLFAGCGGSGSGPGGPGGPSTPTPVATPLAPGDEPTVVIGTTPGLCTAGDVARLDIAADASNRFALKSDIVSCSPAKDNRQEEYTFILYNTTAGAATFKISSPVSSSAPSSLVKRQSKPLLPPKNPILKPVGLNAVDEQATAIKQMSRLSNRGGGLRGGLGQTRDVVVDDEVEFRVRCSSDDPDTFCTTSAILRAQGDHINIFVDRDIPFNFPSNPDSLTTAQMDDVVQIFEENTYPLNKTLVGDESDVDGDGRVSVLITPIVNRNLIVDTGPVEAYTDSRDLLPYDPISNSGSNEQEVIFVYAPDSQGNYGSPDGATGVSAAVYVDRSLNGWIAFQLSKLINYNQHILVNETSADDDWISDGIGAVIADLAGFNIWHVAVQRFLARPQLRDLRTADDLECTLGTAAEYMFMLYYIQSQVDTTPEDADGDDFDDDLGIISTLVHQETVGIDGLEAAIDYDFNEDDETEFQSIFKDWTIALVTSGSGSLLKQSGVDALKYYFDVNPTDYGLAITDGVSSTRTGANGTLGGPNNVGIDLNALTDTNILIENTDEHTWAPGNDFFGYVEPFSAMYVRAAGIFQSTQTVVVQASTSSLQGFVVRRTDVDYPTVYSESIFGTLDQHAEVLDNGTTDGLEVGSIAVPATFRPLAEGPNPYWGDNHGIHKRVDFRQTVLDSAVGGIGRPLTIVGRIDPADKAIVCPADPEECDGFPNTEVPDTDKYELVIPAAADVGGRTDQGEVAISVRRQFDDGSNDSGLRVMLAVVSSKDVPYPYLPHPVRNSSARPEYRWMTSALICGQGDQAPGQVTDVDDGSGGAVGCPVASTVDEAQSRISYTGLAENTGNLYVDVTSPGVWNGDIQGKECDSVSPVTEIGRPGGLFYATNVETSPSPLGFYSWFDFESAGSFPYPAGAFPDVLFAREVLSPSGAYPSSDPEAPFDPRGINEISLNCFVGTSIGSGADEDTSPDSPDDLLMPTELTSPGSLAEQILVEMSRDQTSDPAAGSGGIYDELNSFTIDKDSRDSDANCTRVDLGNNINTGTVFSGEGAMIHANRTGSGFNRDFLAPHIRNQISGSAIPYIDPNTGLTCTGDIGCDANQAIYQQPADTQLVLSPGKSYTIIVGGVGGSTGSYELKIRKINPSLSNRKQWVLTGSARECAAPDDL